jgi:histidinol-phosphate aminotransferase
MQAGRIERHRTEGVFTPDPVARIATAGLERPDSRHSGARPLGPLFLDKNENSDPELHRWLTRLLGRVPNNALSTYPDLGAVYGLLADWLQMPVEQLALVSGCDGAIQRTFEVFVNPGDKVVLTKPTFAMYPVYAAAYGARVEFLNYERSDRGPELPLDRILSAITNLRPRLFCLPNPDSPTGNVMAASELQVVMEICRSAETILLIDEAYHPFSQVTAAPFTASNPHVLVARTFSKAWGLAGLRAGYLIGSPETIEWFHKTRPMYELGGFANACLTQALLEPAEMTASVARLTDGKNCFFEAMDGLGFKVLPSGGNFQHVAFGMHAEKIHAALSPHVLYRADSKDDCLRGYSRFSSTTPELFEPIVDLITKCL